MGLSTTNGGYSASLACSAISRQKKSRLDPHPLACHKEPSRKSSGLAMIKHPKLSSRMKGSQWAGKAIISSVLVALAYATGFAQGSNWQVKYLPNGSTTSYYYPPGDPPFVSPWPYKGGVGGWQDVATFGISAAYLYLDPGAFCYDSASGTQTVKVTWAGQGAAPDHVWLLKDSSAEWEGDTGDCDDGQGDQPVGQPGGRGQISSGKHVQQYPYPTDGSPLQFTLSMSADMAAASPSAPDDIGLGLLVTPVDRHPLDVHVTITPRVKGLSWNTTVHRQECTYGVAATVDQPVQPGYTRSYNWSGAGLTFDNPHAASTTAHEYDSPGHYYANCEVVDVESGSGVVYSGEDAKDCFAIGGPVTVLQTVTADATYWNDNNDATRSVFLTYYDYSHGSAPPTYAEPTQNATASVMGQPQGTTITWTISNNLYSSTLLSNPHASQIDLAAESDFQDSPVTAHFEFIDPLDATVTGSADDDSSTTQFLHRSTWTPLVYKVSGHRPGIFDQEATQPGTISHQQGQDWAATDYKYHLLDTTGTPFPGVWIQERFTDGNPLGLTINGQGSSPWVTALVSSRDGPISPLDGWWQWDHLGYRWAAGDRNQKTTEHEYWAGTRSITSGGVRIGKWTITFTVAAVQGDRGTASQSGGP